MWIANDGTRLKTSPLRQPVELHGGMTATGMLVWIEVGDHRLRVLRRGMRFLLVDELGHQGVSGEAYCVELEDGSYWWLVRDLMTRRWLTERVW